MRDPNRLDKIYDELKQIHKSAIPDWRFGQFVYNFFTWYFTKKHHDIFFIEDDKIIDVVKEYIKEVVVFNE